MVGRGVCTYNYIHLRGWPPRSAVRISYVHNYGGTSVVGAFRGSGDCCIVGHINFEYDGACASGKTSCIAVASQRRLTSGR